MRWLPANRFVRLTVAIVVLLIGVAGAILPVLPGSPFLLIGLIILADDFPWARRFAEWAFRKLERYEACRGPIENYRRNRARREAADLEKRS